MPWVVHTLSCDCSKGCVIMAGISRGADTGPRECPWYLAWTLDADISSCPQHMMSAELRLEDPDQEVCRCWEEGPLKNEDWRGWMA